MRFILQNKNMPRLVSQHFLLRIHFRLVSTYVPSWNPPRGPENIPKKETGPFHLKLKSSAERIRRKKSES